jgi:hypothetical protein
MDFIVGPCSGAAQRGTLTFLETGPSIILPHSEARTILVLKMTQGRLALLLGLIVLSANLLAQIGVLPKKDLRLEAATDPKFRVGDVWEYDNRPDESSSRVTILKIDNSPQLGIIVHVAVDHLTWLDCSNNFIPQQVPHMPFARRALEVSVKRRTAFDQVLPDYLGATVNGEKPTPTRKRASMSLL